MLIAERRISELKGVGSRTADLRAAIASGLKREAVLSSRIEGTTASLGDLNLHEAAGGTDKGASEARRLPEVVNYARALEYALEDVQASGKRVDLDTMRSAHRTLMSGAGGLDPNPGEFRSGQNWIVRRAGGDTKILYAPPPADMVPKLLDDLVEYMRPGDDLTELPLVKCAVAHYQFEAIHPFVDGNGRVGRLLIPLMLRESGLMPEPLLYPSAYFERHRQEYYELLLAVSRDGEWSGWVGFFMRALAAQAEESVALILRLADLRAEYEAVLEGRNARPGALKLVKHLFYNPYTTVPRAGKMLGCTYPTAQAAVASLVDAGILREIGERRRNRVFYAAGIDDVLDGAGREAG